MYFFDLFLQKFYEIYYLGKLYGGKLNLSSQSMGAYIWLTTTLTLKKRIRMVYSGAILSDRPYSKNTDLDYSKFHISV